MRRKKKRHVIIVLFVALLPFFMVEASEVQQVETTGEIGFTGIYEPIGTPDPTPPESIVRPPITEVAKPGGSLPQTNENGSSRMLWLGISIISFVFLFWKRKNKHRQKLYKKKAGIIT